MDAASAQTQLQAMQAQLAQLQAYMPLYFEVQELLQSTKTFLAMMTAIVVFDHLVTMPSEVRYVWRVPFSWINACLLVNRYGIIAELTVILYLFYFPKGSYEDCKKIYLYESYMPSAVLVFANLLLTARVYALWKKNKAVLALMLVLLAILVALHIWIPIKSTPMVLPPGIPMINLPDIRGCLPGSHMEYYWLLFTSSTVFDFVAFVLSIVPCVTEWRKSLQASIGKTLVRDGICFFVLCLTANIANLIYYACAGSHANKAFLAPLATGIQSMCASRMVFNLRAASQHLTSTHGNAGSARTVPTTSSGQTRTVVTVQSSEEDKHTHPRFPPRLHTPIACKPCFPDPLDASEKGEVVRLANGSSSDTL